MSIVGVLINGELTWHLPAVSATYDTLCGLDGNDSHPHVNHVPGPQPDNSTKITCSECYVIWRGVRSLRVTEKSFAASAK